MTRLDSRAYLVKLNHVRVSNLLKDVDLTSHSLHIAFVLNAVLFQDLDRHFLPSYRVSANSYFAEGPRTERLSYI